MSSRAAVAGALLLAALGVGITSCAKAPPDSKAPYAEEGSTVDLRDRCYYRPPAMPRCHFVKLGHVETRIGRREVDSEGVWRRITLCSLARRAGGDAVVSVTPMYEMDSSGKQQLVGWEGVAIRFTKPECTR